MRYFFHIGFNGANYRGWQKFKGVATVQDVMERSLSQVLKIPARIVCCGRTDAQVHASQFFFHVDIDKLWDCDLVFRLNKNLPADIAVFDIIGVEDEAHARFDAAERTYDYFIHTYKDPFLSTTSAFYPLRNLDTGKIKQAASLLRSYKDFRAFCKAPLRYRTTYCHIKHAEWFSDSSGNKLRFSITADRFLGNMIRIIAGKLLLVGQGKMSIGEFEQLLISGETPAMLHLAYPQGLYLSKVTYPYLDLPRRTDFVPLSANGFHEWQSI